MLSHLIHGDKYTIMDEDNKIVFQLTLAPEFPNNQVVIKTKDEVYAGPIDFLHFKED